MTSDEFHQTIKQRMSHYTPKLLNTEQKHAAVLLPIALGAEPSIILTTRAAHLKSHPGDVSFPGGMVEQFDKNIEATALRETHEEINLEPHQFHVHGRLSSALSKNGIVVQPVVATIKDARNCIASPDEIAEIFHVPWRFFAETAPELTPINRHGIEIQVPHFHFEGHHIWGLTAMILLEFINLVEHKEWPLPPFYQTKAFSR